MYDATVGVEREAGAGRETDHRPFPDDALSLLLRRLARFGTMLEPHHHGGVQVSMSEVLALGELTAATALSQSDLGDLLGLEKSTVSRLVAGMERRGWLTRERDPANRRYSRLALTEDGRRAAARVGQDLHDRHQRLFSGLSPLEQEALAIGLTALARELERHGPAPRR